MKFPHKVISAITTKIVRTKRVWGHTHQRKYQTQIQLLLVHLPFLHNEVSKSYRAKFT
jgi:hypothetical protein